MLSVGEILKKTREKENISLEQVEKELRIRKKFLTALENNNWTLFSSKIYIEGIIKNYSKLLNLNEEKTLAFFRREYEKTEVIKFKRRISSKYLTSETKKFIYLFIVLIFIFFIGYFIFQLKLFLSPPKISIIEPKINLFNRVDRVMIIGKTEKEASVTILNDRVYQNSEGIFKFNLPLKKGENEIVIEVIGANGKKSVLRKVYVREN